MKSAIPTLDKMSSSFGIPLKVKSDNGSLFDCGDFDKYSPLHLDIPKKTVQLKTLTE